MTINGAWRKAHRMPRNAMLDERVAWHVAHAKACGCRPMPRTVREAMTKRGMKIPARKSP